MNWIAALYLVNITVALLGCVGLGIFIRKAFA